MAKAENQYSLIVIGAGLTGLSTALSWLKAYPGTAHRVLVLERNSVVGGCVTTFARKGYRFDTTQIIPDVSDLLEFFEIEVPLKKFSGYYARLFMADTTNNTAQIYSIPSSPTAFEDSLCQRFPSDEKAIKRFFRNCLRMQSELNYLKTEPKWYQLPLILAKCPTIIFNSSRTYHQFLDQYKFKDPELYRILDVFTSFSGLSGNRCAALLTACAMVTTLKGSFRPEKGFIQFPMVLKNKLDQLGIEIRTRMEVTSIVTDKEKVRGVTLDNGETITSDHVVCTADTKLVYTKLIEGDHLKPLDEKFYHKAQTVKMSPSAFSIHLGLDDQLELGAMGFNCGYNVLSSGADAFQKLFDAWERGELVQSDNCFHMAVICPSLMTGGKPTLIIRVVPVYAPYWIDLQEKNYNDYLLRKEFIAEFYIRKVEQYMIPDLTKHILFKDISTPATFKRYIGSPSGSQYDMMPVPDNFGKTRLKTRTPVRGLFVPKFSHGIWPSLQAGLQVIDMISGGKIMDGNSSYRKPH